MLEYIRARYKLFLLLFVFWLFLSSSLDPLSLIKGGVVSLVLSIMAYGVFYGGGDKSYRPFHPPRIFRYIVMLLVTVFRSALQFLAVLFFKRYAPVVFTMKLDVKDDVELGIIANSITLTPGTMTVESNKDEKTVTVLTIASEEATRDHLEKVIRKRFEGTLKQYRKEDSS